MVTSPFHLYSTTTTKTTTGTMEDGCTLSSSDGNQFVGAEMDSFLPNLESSDLQHLQLKGDRLAWKNSLDSLKSFVMCDLQQQGKWTSPGGNMKQFKGNNKNLIINWYSKKQHTLCFQGRDGPTLKERLGSISSEHARNDS